ncbi:MAG: TMEM165/GDT1 family protein [Candidatus Binatia bacterium]
MDGRTLLTVFTAVMIAELGDKTQVATMLFAADKEVSKATVFLAAASALVVTSAIGVALGAVLAQYLNAGYLHYATGCGFIAIGLWMLWAGA